LPEHIADDALKDPEIQRLSSVLTISEDDHANLVFPGSRLARADITLKNGQVLSSTWFEPKWDASVPPTKKELTKKFRDYAIPVLGKTRTKEIYEAVFNLDRSDTQQLFRLISSQIQKPVANVS